MKRLHIALRISGLILIATGAYGFIDNGSGGEAPIAHRLFPLPEQPDGRPATHKEIPAFVHDGLDWLVKAQYDNGGWGAGQHTAQDIRDPKGVKIDPATTAFAAMALLRTGNTLADGKYSGNLKKALFHLLETVEKASDEGSSISDVVGTQPQAKLGQHIDLSMCAQFFGKVLPYAEQDALLKGRIEKALDKCVAKLERAQQSDGSWNSGGWAPVLQSAMANSALEQAQAVGREVDEKALERSKDYQRSNLDADARSVRTEAGAGIQLYAVASTKRANVKDVVTVKREIEKMADSIRATGAAVDEEIVLDLVSTESFIQRGYDRDKAEAMMTAYRQNSVAQEMLTDDRVLAGFGNNGGEEFLSFMMTSESLALEGGEKWDAWYAKMSDLFGKIRNGDGSWSGHHCITSPVFCTAAVIMAMTADRDTQAFELQ